MKKCNVCKEDKDSKSFHKNRKSLDGLQSTCIICAKKRQQANYDKINISRRKHYQKNLDKMRTYIRKKNKEKREKGYFKNYKKKNAAKLTVYYRERSRKDRQNPQIRLKDYISNRIRIALKKNVKNSSSSILLGCSIQYLKEFLEARFQLGMSWENYGFYGWHVDHIKPCCSFDLSKPEEQRKCFHYTNLQPLWAIDNFRKIGADKLMKKNSNIQKRGVNREEPISILRRI